MKKTAIKQCPKVWRLLELWEDYERYRLSGKYNMITEGKRVAELMKIDLRQYAVLQDNYGKIKKAINILASIADDVLYDLD